MAKKVSKALDAKTPAAMIKEDQVYKAWFGDETTDQGALTNELKSVSEFINYYTRTQTVDEAETNLLEYIVKIFSGLRRHYSEPDDYLRLRYKALVERRNTVHWNGKNSIGSVFTYVFDKRDIYLIEQYPVENLIQNGNFETLDSWEFDNVDTDFRIIYSWSFEGGSALHINPSIADSEGYVEQRMTVLNPGIYELLFFYSSPKDGNGDVLFSIRDAENRHWNGETWIENEYYFYEDHNDESGYYKKIQKSIPVPAETDIIVRFKNKNGSGTLIDSVRFGLAEHPAIRIYIMSDPEIFYNDEIFYDKKYNHTGYRKFYIQSDMQSILEKIKPAGVYAELTLLTSRLNIPWDRIILTWNFDIVLNWHRTYNGEILYNSGSIVFHNVPYDGSVLYDGSIKYDGIKSELTVGPNDILYGEPLMSEKRKYKTIKRVQVSNKIYYNGMMGYNGRFTHTGIIDGAMQGHSTMIVKEDSYGN